MRFWAVVVFGAATIAAASCTDSESTAEDFCERSQDVLDQLGTVNPGADPDQFASIVDEMEGIEAPSAIRSDWDALVGVLGALRDADASQVEEVNEALGRFEALDDEKDRIQEYMESSCG